MVKTTKKISAQRQIFAAIKHFEAKNYECAITLAGAGEGQIKEPSITTHLFRLIRARFTGDEANYFVNWMKHSSGPDSAEIEELEVVTTIIRAIQKFIAYYKETTPTFQKFGDWCIEKGYTKIPLGEEEKAGG